MMTDLKFFTNEPERDLYSRFSAILKSNTQFFDVLVGYFRTSGFFRLVDAMKTVEHIRILVGLNVDRFTVKIIDRAKDEIKYMYHSCIPCDTACISSLYHPCVTCDTQVIQAADRFRCNSSEERKLAFTA